MKFKLLLIAFSDSIHTARWIAQLDRDKFDIHLFPSVLSRSVHPGLNDLTIHLAAPIAISGDTGNNIRVRYVSPLVADLPPLPGTALLKKLQVKYATLSQAAMLGRLVNQLKPAVVHTMETQHAGYLYRAAKTDKRIPWIHSTWGIDLHFFKDMPAHRERLQKMLAMVSLLITEGKRDQVYASGLGYTGKATVIPSVGGGFNFDEFDAVDEHTPPSARNTIIIKGYEGHERLASNALLALRQLKELLKGVEIIVYSCSDQLLPVIDALHNQDKLSIRAVKDTERNTILKMTAAARISITNNLSDGVPNTMLEAMALGSFPIQSGTAITEGWIQDGFNGFVTEPESVTGIAAAIERALINDGLVDSAAIYNRRLVRERLDKTIMKKVIENIYLNMRTISGGPENKN